MNFLLTAIVAVLVFGTVVLVHEAGHFFAARHCGIHVEEFSIGFGPALWSTVRGGTRYSVRLLPLGGYNTLPVKPRKNLRTRTSRSGQNLRKSRMLPLLLCIPMIRMFPCSP